MFLVKTHPDRLVNVVERKVKKQKNCAPTWVSSLHMVGGGGPTVPNRANANC